MSLDPHMILTLVLIGVAVVVFLLCLVLEVLRIDPVRLVRRLTAAPDPPRRELTVATRAQR